MTPAVVGCPDGFAHYYDDSSEGRDSCILVTQSSDISSFNDAAALCAANGAHLVTVTSASSLLETSQLAFTASEVRGQMGTDPVNEYFAVIGCSQDSDAPAVDAGWRWVDARVGTAGLNCDGAGCGLWDAFEPK